MGLENRDYLRDESFRYGDGGGGGRGFSMGSHAPMCKRLLIITIAVFLLQIFSTREWTNEELTARRDELLQMHRQMAVDLGATEAELEAVERQPEIPLDPTTLGLPQRTSVAQDWLQLETPKVFSGQIWRLVTCAFCHDRINILHIVFNMLFFWWFGPRLEAMYGSKEFLFFYLSAAIISSVCYIGLDLATGDPTPMIGASGAVMAVTMLFALHFPNHVIYVFFVIPIEMRWIVLIYAVMDLHPILLALSGESLFNDNVAHAAHLGGLAFGYIYGKKQLRLIPYWSGISTWWKAKRRGLKVVRPSTVKSGQSQRLADEMDAILKKISEQGEASLTSAERKTLEKASRELRDRKG